MRVIWVHSGNLYRALFSWGANGVRAQFEAYEGQGKAATGVKATLQELDAHLDRCIPDIVQWGSLGVITRKLVEAGLTAQALPSELDQDLKAAVLAALRQAAPGKAVVL
jgi:hypothetical protein